MKKNKKTYLLILILNLLLLIYISIIGTISVNNDWYGYIVGFKVDLWVLLITMFGFELLSTLSFQTRIWLTSKDRIIIAAFVGGFSWLIAGFQGLLLINGSINGLNDLLTFLVKMPPVFVATVSGILINNLYKREVK